MKSVRFNDEVTVWKFVDELDPELETSTPEEDDYVIIHYDKRKKRVFFSMYNFCAEVLHNRASIVSHLFGVA
ncbi:hypothetical protein BOX15_Mlig023910g1 [Macrostomum lignano]|uniref:Uncharacterized protein n=1 Tax=Macrostomum lignano TaxID=282301 RepID=A0A267F3D5_9PLAT|nr:hypothetical protein BOX15_Mlig023910g1 [Macrostomum lignano]